MSLITKTYTFSAGATIIAAEHNSNFDTIYADYNGNITNANCSASMALALSKISFTTALTMSGAITKWAKGADVASTAGTITLGEDGNFFDITGTAAITSITAKTAGTVVMMQFDSTASLVDGSNLKLNGTFQGAAESTITLVSDGSNWFEISRSPSFTNTVTNALSGSVIQTLNTQSAAVDTTATAFTSNNSSRTTSEGKNFFSRAITPNNASNLLEIVVIINVAASGTSGLIAAWLTQDAGASAICTGRGNYRAGSVNSQIGFTYYMTAGTTSSTTFKVWAAPDTGTLTVNGAGGSGLDNSAMFSSITVREIKA